MFRPLIPLNRKGPYRQKEVEGMFGKSYNIPTPTLTMVVTCLNAQVAHASNIPTVMVLRVNERKHVCGILSQRQFRIKRIFSMHNRKKTGQVADTTQILLEYLAAQSRHIMYILKRSQ